VSDLVLGQLDRFAPRNTFLYALLGLRSLSLRCEALVRGAAPSASEPSEVHLAQSGQSGSTAESAGDTELRFAILGSLSLARSAGRHLSTSRTTSHAQPSGSEPQRRRESPRELSR
jgi:hypothetical protein